MKNLAKAALATEFLLCFSWIALLWMTGCFFGFWALGSFSIKSNEVGFGLLFFLWLAAGGMGIAGMTRLLFHFFSEKTRPPAAIAYVAIVLGMIANLMLSLLMHVSVWNHSSELSSQEILAIVAFNAPIICAIHFIWLSIKRYGCFAKNATNIVSESNSGTPKMRWD